MPVKYNANTMRMLADTDKYGKYCEILANSTLMTTIDYSNSVQSFLDLWLLFLTVFYQITVFC